MNLSGDPWVPVVGADGKYELVSLKALFNKASSIADLCIDPHQRVALMRFLIALVQRALNGPVDDTGWKNCRSAIPSAATAYLDMHHEKFELYGPSAFLQAPGLKATGNASLDKLDFGLASGNNHTLFDHGASPEGRMQSPAWQALMLITYQNFSPGGLIGTTEWNGKGTNSKSEHAPAIEGSPLHIFLQADNILDTIHMNLVPFARLKTSEGVPIWEKMPTGPDDCSENNATYLGRMIPMPRAIKLEDSKSRFTLANGLKYPKLPEYIDPLLIVMPNKKNTYSYLRINPDKHPWRELHNILTVAEGGGRAAMLDNLKNLGPEQTVRIWTGGLAADKAKLENTGEWMLNVPVKIAFGDNIQKTYAQGVELADQSEGLLKESIKKYMAEIVKDSARDSQSGMTGKGVSEVVAYFWHNLDQKHETLLEESEKQDLGKWRELLIDTARNAFISVCSCETPRRIEAFVSGKGYLEATLNKIINKKKEVDAK